MTSNQETILYIVRHAETEWNEQGRFQGHKDSPLTVLGIEQAKNVAEEFKNIKFDAMYSSDSDRVLRTAEYIRAEKDMIIKTTKLLRERNMGPFEGRTYEEVTKEYKESFDKFIALQTIKEKLEYKHHPDYESSTEMLSRLLTVLREIALAHEGQTVLVATHGGTIRALLTHLDEKYYRSKAHNTAWIKLSSDGVFFNLLDTKRIEENFHPKT